jgi:hypothetical protein
VEQQAVRRPMGFVQIIELNTTKAEELIALDREWEKASEGKRTPDAGRRGL